MERMQSVTVEYKKKEDEWKRATSQGRYRVGWSLGFCDFTSRLDQRGQGAEGLAKFEKGVFEQLRCSGPFFGVDLQRLRQVVLEYRRQRFWVRDRGRAIRRNEIQGFQWVLVEVRGFTLDHLW